MIPSARIQTCLELLERIFSSRVPMDLTIGDYMRPRRYIGSKDRADTVSRLYGIMRHKARLSWALENCGALESPRNLLIAFLVLIENTSSLSGLFGKDKYGPSPLSEEEENLISRLSSLDFRAETMPQGVRCECPPAYEAALRLAFGPAFEDEMKAFLFPAPLDLRVNLLMGEREAVQKSLAEDKVDAAPCPYSPWGLRLPAKTYLSETRAFRKGLADIQDEGSQLIALVCDARPGQQVLDYCAGAGGKTLALAGAMRKKGRIVAMDLEAGRLEKAKERFRRANVSDIIEPRPLSEERNRKWLRRQKGTFDIVLADVPCSGTGTWRRSPDLRWRSYGPSLSELVSVQAEILEKVSPCVKEGGRLVYATCSLLPAENENQIESFLNRHPEFDLIPPSAIWPAGLPCPCSGPYLRLSPLQHGTDGFFAAVLTRKPAL